MILIDVIRECVKSLTPTTNHSGVFTTETTKSSRLHRSHDVIPDHSESLFNIECTQCSVSLQHEHIILLNNRGDPNPSMTIEHYMRLRNIHDRLFIIIQLTDKS